MNAIADETDGVVTAKLAATSLSSLGELTTASTDDITITVNDAANAAVSATDLSTLGGKTDGTGYGKSRRTHFKVLLQKSPMRWLLMLQR